MMLRRIVLLASLLSIPLTAATVEQIAGGGSGAPGVAALEIEFVEPFGVAFDSEGNLFVIEYAGNRLIRIDAEGKTSLIAGEETFFEPHGLVINDDDQMFIADTHNNRVLRIDVATGEMATVAGNGEKGYSGDGGAATEAAFNGIFSIDLSPDGRSLHVADLSNRRVRRIDLRSGIVTTVAGNGEEGVPVDGALAAESPLVNPRAAAADRNGNVYVLERSGNALRVVDTEGRIRTLIKPGDISPDLSGPKHLCIDADDNVIIADAENHLVRHYDVLTGKTTTIVGTAVAGDETHADDPSRTQVRRPHGVIVGPDGALYVTDSYNHRILRVQGL